MSLAIRVLKTVTGTVLETGIPDVPSAVPDAPLNVVATTTDTELQLSWDTPPEHGSPIYKYVVSITSPAGISPQTTTSGSPGVAFDGLTASTAYSYSIVAYNARGASAAATGTQSTTAPNSSNFDPRSYFAPMINGTGIPAGLGPQIDEASMTHYSVKGIMNVGTGANAVGSSFTGMVIDGDAGQVTKILSVGGSKGSWGTGNGSAVVATFTDCVINTNVDASGGAISFVRCKLAPTAASQHQFTLTNSGGVTVGSTRMDHCIVEGIIDASDPGADCVFQYTYFADAKPEPIFGKLYAGGMPGDPNATDPDFFPVEYCSAPYLEAFDGTEVITQAMLDAAPVLRYVYVKSYTDPANGKTTVINNRVFLQAIAPGLSDTTNSNVNTYYSPSKAYYSLSTGDDTAPFVFTGGVASTQSAGGQAVPGTYAGTGAIWIPQGGLNHADGLQWSTGGRCEVYRSCIYSPSNSPLFVKAAAPKNPQPTTGIYAHDSLLYGGYNWWILLQHLNGPTNPNYAAGKSGYPGSFYRNPSNLSQWLCFTSNLGGLQPRAIRIENNWFGPQRDGVTYPKNPITDGSSINGEHLNYVTSVAAFVDAIVRQFSGYTFSAQDQTEIGEGIFDWAAWEAVNFVSDGNGNLICPVLNEALMNTRWAAFGFDGECDARTWVISAGNLRADTAAPVNPTNYQDGN